MDKFLPIKKQVRIQEWQQRIQECQSSGMKVYEWCALNNISKDAYYYWLRKCREVALSNLPAELKTNLQVAEEPAEPISFKRLEVQSPVSNMQAAVVIKLPYATLEVTNGANQQTVEAVLLALKSVC